MKTPNKLVIANLRQNKKRTMATLVAIILSCTLLFAVGIAYSSYLQYQISNTAKDTGSYHALYYDMDYKDTSSYLNNKNIKDVYVLQQISKFEKDEMAYQILSFSELNPEINISIGRAPENDKEILISENAYFGLKLNLDDTFEGYKVVGTYNNNYILEEYPYGDGWLDTNPIRTFLTKKDLDESNEHSCFFITFKNVKKAYEIMNKDAKHFGYASISDEHIQINKYYLQANGVGKDTSAYAMKILAIALALYIISIFCMLIIYNAFAISLAERKKQFGTLRSIGTSKKSIIGMITKEILMLSLIAFPISFLLGLGLVYGGLNSLDILLEIKIPVTFNSLISLITLFFVVFAMVLSAYTPGRKASKTSPMEAIRNTRDYKIKKNTRNYNLTKKIFGPEGQLARKNLKRNGKQFGTVITSLTVSMILFILVSTVVNLLTIELRTYENDGDYSGTEIKLQVNYKDRSEAISFIDELDNIKYIDSKTVSIPSVRTFFEDDNPNYTEIAQKSFSRYVPVYALEKESFDEFIKTNDLTPGKIYFINVSKFHNDDYENEEEYQIFTEASSLNVCKIVADEKICDFTIDNIELINKNIEINGWTTMIVMEMSQFDDYIDKYPEYFRIDSKYYHVSIESKEYLKIDKDIEKLIAKYPSLSIYYRNEQLEIYKEKRKILYIEIIVYAIIGFVGLISIVGLLNSINNNLNLREREFAMLRSMGYSKKSLNKMITLENIFLISKSFIYSLIISIVGILALNQFVDYTNYDRFIFPAKWIIPYPWVYTIIAFIVVILLILFLTSFSIKKIKNQNIIEAIRKDSI